MQEKDNKKRGEDLAFLIGPRLDGIVRTKDDTLLTLQEDPLLTNNKALKVYKPNNELRLNEELPIEENPDRNTWTSTLLMVQHRNLKMRYKVQTKKRAKLMRAIRQHARKTLSGSTHDKQKGITISKLNELRLLVPTQLSPFDITTAYDKNETENTQKKKSYANV